jgi:anti-anti-sigma factor
MTGFRVNAGPDGVFYVAGELDIVSADRLEAAVSDRLEAASDLVLDVADVSFVDSTGIRAFLRLAGRITPRCVVLRRPQANVARVLEIVGIHSFGIRVEHDPPP